MHHAINSFTLVEHIALSSYSPVVSVRLSTFLSDLEAMGVKLRLINAVCISGVNDQDTSMKITLMCGQHQYELSLSAERNLTLHSLSPKYSSLNHEVTLRPNSTIAKESLTFSMIRFAQLMSPSTR